MLNLGIGLGIGWREILAKNIRIGDVLLTSYKVTKQLGIVLFVFVFVILLAQINILNHMKVTIGNS